jgi:nucleoside diphosphate kinase
MQRTLLLVRGDDIESGLRGKVIEKFEKAGFQLVAMKLAKANESKL